MSVQLNNNASGNIGRMYARQNVPSVYGAGRSAKAEDAAGAAETVDRVSLSPLAPRPLSAGFLENALDAGRSLADGGKLSAGRVDQLREDRIFGAMSVLAAMGEEGDAEAVRRSWPGGIPSPTREELEAARRRLAQRLDNLDEARDPQGVQQSRLALLHRIGKGELPQFAGGDSVAVAALAASA